MKIVVIGGTGLIGSKTAAILRQGGHDVVAASPNSGVNTITGEGLKEAMAGTDRTPDNGYFRAKVAQEKLIEASGIPYTIIRSTQFLEFLRGIADSSTDGNIVRVSPGAF